MQVIPGQLYLHLIRNPGAAFSMGEGATVLLTCLAIAAADLCWSGWCRRCGTGVGGRDGPAARRRVEQPVRPRLFREPGPFHGHVIDFLQVPWFAVFQRGRHLVTFAAVTVITADRRSRR
ncbi:MAG: hypothetical protein R2742_03045 [Micropruina glycogenica]